MWIRLEKNSRNTTFYAVSDGDLALQKVGKQHFLLVYSRPDNKIGPSARALFRGGGGPEREKTTEVPENFIGKSGTEILMEQRVVR